MDRQERLERFAEGVTDAVQDKCLTGYEYVRVGDLLYPIPDQLAPPCWFRGRWVRIEDHHCGEWTIVIRAPYATDGCTLAPDFSHGATFSRACHTIKVDGPEAGLRLCGPLAAHWAHDAMYQFAVEMADAFGWSIWRTIRWANRYFDWVMGECGTPRWQRWLYFGAVTLVGHQFAFVGRQARAVREWFGK